VSASFGESADNFLQDVVTTTQRKLGAPQGRLPVGEPVVNWRGVDKPLHLAAHKDGRIVVVDRDTDSVATQAASLFAHVIESMPALGQLEWSADSARDSVRFDIAFVTPVLDSAGHVHKATSEREAVSVFSVLAPWERTASMKPGQTPPHYPGDALQWRKEATVVLIFLADTMGHAIASSIRDVWSKDKPRPTGRDLVAYQSFLEETERAVTKIAFTPASIGGCLVKQLVEMPFVFTIGR
jgi:hypothetical protein